MRKTDLQEWDVSNMCLPDGYCLCVVPESYEAIAELWHDVGKIIHFIVW